MYLPLFTNVLTDSPKALSNGSQNEVNHESLWWACTSLANWMDTKYSYMIEDVRNKQKTLEEEVLPKLIAQIEGATDPLGKDRESLAKINVEAVDSTREAVWSLFWDLVAKFQNGYADYGKTPVGYPKEWLQGVGYDKFAATPEQFDQQAANFANAQTEADAIRKKHPGGAETAILI